MTKSILTLLLLISFITACGTSPSDPTQTDKDFAQPTDLTKTIEGVEYYLSVDKTQINLDDKVKVNASVKNVSDKPINYIGYNGCDNGVSTFISVTEHNTRLLQPNREFMSCTEAIVNYTLEPGETISEEKTFIPYMNLGTSKEVAVPTGEYSIQLIFKQGNDYEVHEPQAELPLHINGSEKILTEEEAKRISRENEEVQIWMKNKNGESVTKSENTTYFVKDNGEWQKTTKQLYERMKDYKPYSNIEFDKGKWVITFIDKLQGPPHRLEVHVDPKSGEVTKVNKYNK